MATLANNAVLNTNGGGANWQWHFTITTREDANNYYVDISTYVIGAQYYTYQMDLVSNDIWWNLNFDGSSFEVFRLYISNGRYQTLSAQTKYGVKTVTKTYAKTSSAQSKKVSFGITGSATIATNLLGTASNGSVSFTIPAGYTAPSNFKISENSKTTTSTTIKATWTPGNKTTIATITCNGSSKNITSSGGTVTFSNLTPNTNYTITGSLDDGVLNSPLQSSLSITTNLAAPSSWSSVSSTASSITAIATSPNGGSFNYQYRINNGDWQNSSVFNNLAANTQYTVEARCSNGNATTSSISTTVWTYPTPIILYELIPDKEDSEANVFISSSVNSGYDQFSYSINDGVWSDWNTKIEINLTGLTENTNYTVSAKMNNTSSGLTSDITTIQFTTWHSPLTNLAIKQLDKWFWLLKVQSLFDYSGSISKYEYAFGDENYVESAESVYTRGSADDSFVNNLEDNTTYICKARLTDEHGRVYTAENSFTTLDERSLFINGELKELKIIDTNNNIMIISPNLLTIVQENGNIVNMNKIINNDERITYE